MTGLHTGSSHTVNQFFASRFLVCFQRRPGPGDPKVITDLGSGRLRVSGRDETEIRAANGIYPLPLKVGESGTFEIIGIRFNVAMLDGSDWQGAGSAHIVGWDGDLADHKTLAGVQQRLQILGYYTGRIDGQNGRLTERAVLEFQADEGRLLIDGEWEKPRTQARLHDYYEEHAFFGGGATPLIRRYLLSFKRAKTGSAHYLCPHPDYRGGDNTVVSYGIGDSSPPPFLIGMAWETPGPPSQSLYPVVNEGNTEVVEPQGDPIAADLAAPLALTARLPGTVTVQIRAGSREGPSIGELSVQIHELRQVNVAVHILSVASSASSWRAPKNQGGEKPAGFLIVDKDWRAPDNKWNEELAVGLIADVNGVLAPAGVEFRVKSLHWHSFLGRNTGTITTHYRDWPRKEHNRIWASHNIKGRINVYFVNKLLEVQKGKKPDDRVLGFALSRKNGIFGRIGVCVQYSDDRVRLARTVAHELGHMLELTRHRFGHSDDNSTDTPFRHDIWSRTRLMAKYAGYHRTDPDRSWQDPGYGMKGSAMNAGCLITAKRLANDGTDDEVAIARGASSNPY